MNKPEFFELKYLVHRDAMLKRKARRKSIQCDGKHRFDSFGEAQKTMRPELRKVAHVFHCDMCHGYHIGNSATHRVRRLANKRRRDECEFA